MNITIQEIQDNMLKIFDKTKVQSLYTIFEKTNKSDEYRLIIDLNKVMFDHTAILYTKIIFITDQSKENLKYNYFNYLSDYNKTFTKVDFSDIDDFKTKILDVFKNNKFSKDILNISEFIKSPVIKLNEWLNENEVKDVTVSNVVFVEQFKIISTDILKFKFNIKVNNNEIEVYLLKENNNYKLKMKFGTEFFEKEFKDTKFLIENIGFILKDNIKK